MMPAVVAVIKQMIWEPRMILPPCRSALQLHFCATLSAAAARSAVVRRCLDHHACGCWCAGRAERLGLAISLVSRVPEKVWYCRQKGYKPWLKPKERDTRIHEEGGHTIWYNEQELLKVSPASSMKPGQSGGPGDRARARALQCQNP